MGNDTISMGKSPKYKGLNEYNSAFTYVIVMSFPIHIAWIGMEKSILYFKG